MSLHHGRPVTRLGLQIPSFTYPGVSDAELFGRVAEIAETAEDSGFDSVWVMDHFYQIHFQGQPTEPMLECYTTLGGIAARTSQVRLGALVTGVTYRNPALLAKIVSTLDIVSSGRAILGIGAAWNQDEHRGYGFDFPPVSERFERLEEALQICRAMFREETPSFQGKHYRIEEALNFPRPINPGGPPILIGGSGEKRTLRLVAKYADACNLFGDAATIKHKLDVLRQHCEDVGRDPAEITKTRLGGLVIAPTHEDAERRGAELMAARGLSEEWYRMSQIVGDPDEVGERVQELLDAGLDGVIFNMWRVQDLEPVALAGRTLSKLLG
jgi:F420-dependent oxidoreductase-like protein